MGVPSETDVPVDPPSENPATEVLDCGPRYSDECEVLDDGLCLDPENGCPLIEGSDLESKREFLAELATTSTEAGPPHCAHVYLDVCESNPQFMIVAFGELGEWRTSAYPIEGGTCVGVLFNQEDRESEHCDTAWVGQPDLLPCVLEAQEWLEQTAETCWPFDVEVCQPEVCIRDFSVE